MKWLLMLFLCLACSLALCVVSLPDNQLHFYACDVGQGDAFLFVYKDNQIVIDGGKDSRALGCIKKIIPIWDTTLELVIATHADADHIGGLDDVILAYTVDTLFIPSQTKKTTDFADFNNAVSRKRKEGTLIYEPKEGDSIVLGDLLKVQVLQNLGRIAQKTSEATDKNETQLWDQEQQLHENAMSNNDGSIVTYVVYNKVSFLMTGDLEKAGEQALLHGGLIKEATVLKVGHHGSKSSSGEVFLKRVRPEIAVISAGKKNKYGHPHVQTVKNLLSVGADILRTDMQGTVHILSDGTSVKQATLMPWVK